MSVNRTIFGLRTKQDYLIYEAAHPSFKEALEDAVGININLTGVDLSGKDLQHINLDGINLSNADFRNSNLTGANISEARLENCDFSGAALFETCFCYSDLSNCNFEDGRFGLTDFSQCGLSDSVFSLFSAHTIPFRQAIVETRNFFRHEGRNMEFNAAPLTLTGLKSPVSLIGNKILIGNDLYDLAGENYRVLTELMHEFLMPPSIKH